MNTGNLLFWSVTVPIILFGSELWVLQASDLHELDLFQRQVGRRMQRLHRRAPTHTSFRGLGWMRLETDLCEEGNIPQDYPVHGGGHLIQGGLDGLT